MLSDRLRYDDDLDEDDETHLKRLLVEALQQFAAVFPNDSYVARQLAQAYMESGLFDQATLEAERAIQLRDGSPKMKVLHWQIKLYQAMHAARTKAKHAMVQATLDEAIALWPVWQNREWIPFLKAAAELRLGNAQASAQLRSQAVSEGKIPALTAALMFYVACQKFYVPAQDSKSFRTELDACFKGSQQT